MKLGLSDLERLRVTPVCRERLQVGLDDWVASLVSPFLAMALYSLHRFIPGAPPRCHECGLHRMGGFECDVCDEWTCRGCQTSQPLPPYRRMCRCCETPLSTDTDSEMDAMTDLDDSVDMVD